MTVDARPRPALAAPVAPVRSTRGRLRRALATIGYHGTAAPLALLFLFPIVWAALNSIKPTSEANQSPPAVLPTTVSWENYEALGAAGAGVARHLVNSLVVSGLTVVGTVVLAVLAGYGFARFRFRGKNLVFLGIIAILMVPYATLLLPLYFVMARIGLANSFVGLALVLIVFQLPFSVFIMRNSFESIPRELEEAAWVDGCGTVRSFWYIAMPVVIPGVVTAALFAFLNSWNEFLAPLVFLSDGSKYTLPLMLVNLRSGAYGSIDWGALQAGATVSIVPCLVLYLVLQRFYVSGLVSGALRG